ncbi:hypothetical protein [Nocardia sp. NBC_01388]|uniref:hypothetical protein n=1 Tax=Nocardia sp. NBC_01388 TaxID=2903596 RepID=UPI002F90DC49
MFRRYGPIVRLFALGVTVGTTVLLMGCAPASPQQQSDRERRAATVPVFRLRMMNDLWANTSEEAFLYPGVSVHRPKSKTEDPDTGMATIELTGSQMVAYLQNLDYNAHGGGTAQNQSLSKAVYDTIVPVLDSIQDSPAPGAPAPEIVVSATSGGPTSPPPLIPER